MQQSSATPSLHLWFWGVAEDCCMLSLLLAVPSCIYSFWHGVIPTSYFIFNDFYTCSIIHVSPSVYTKLPSCIYSFWHGVIPTSYFIFNDFYTCIICIVPVFCSSGSLSLTIMCITVVLPSGSDRAGDKQSLKSFAKDVSHIIVNVGNRVLWLCRPFTSHLFIPCTQAMMH